MPQPIIQTASENEAHDPIAAYDRIAPVFGCLTEQRMPYLNRVDEVVISQIPHGSRSLLDVGAGDGRRARRIAQSADLTDIVLVEPSVGMQGGCAAPAVFRTLRAEQLQSLSGRFDVIVCLWNVLGHVFPHNARAEAMRQFARLTASGGRIFVDVNHRYNVAQYGAALTAFRLLYDWLRPAETNGDVVATWKVRDVACSVRGHVFTHPEVQSLARAAGLTIEKRFAVDYGGQVRRSSYLSNLLYVLRPAYSME